MAQIKEKENELPQIGDFSWGNKSKRKKRRPLASTSTVNGLTSVSVPQRAEINDPIFQLKGQKMTTQRVVDEQLANTIAMNNEKREAIRKRAQELAEQKKQRKAYSTPLYTSLTERKQNLKPHIQSSRHHSSLPVSPVQRKEKIPSPKEVWQAADHSITEKRPSPSPVPMKREISIKLVSPTPEDEVKDEEDDKDKLSEKKVTFIDEGKKTTPKSSKIKKAKRKKGKAKTQSKPIKVEKAPKKPAKKVVEEKPQEQMQKVIPKPKPEPPSKPILAGIGAQQKPVKAMAQGVKPEMKVSEEKLPVSKPADIEPVTEEEIIKPKSPANERGKSIVEQREIVKKEKRDGRKCVKKSEETTKPLPELEVDAKKVDPWIFDQDDFSEKKDLGKEDLQVEIEPLPVLSGDLNPELIEKEKKERKENKRKSVLASLIGSEKTIKKWRKPGHLDSSYADELRRLELAEERRKRQMEMFERLKNRRVSNFSDAFDDGSPRFEDCKIKSRPMSGECRLDFDDGFLAKYCIFTKGNIEMYRHAFDAVDEGSSGWLEGEDVMIALRGVNNKLTEAEEEYLYRVLELTGYKLTHGADFKIFSVLAALSQRISALDKWMKNLIGKMDFKALEMKMFKCKTLWECNVDKDTNSISIDQLCVDLRAGGVSYEHETEVREKLAHLHAIDLLDFLTYIPLFIMIHESVVRNPLDDTRNK
ncbi:muscle M-line assembly protein unc-89-like isoform X10 [Ruditapes philippinarum]|uniref:muscle M-line assembly protein unc-89-like isoform X10 n=1 Tax=Ruditapes philippinarum TaxID=129788 RepID=UPI00295B17AA|nr:muscle M-line assembly protein unc-89-like isoform X10 [Ruditapes philippinarum]